MASSRAATEVKTSRRMRRRVMTEKKPSTALIQEAELSLRGRSALCPTRHPREQQLAGTGYDSFKIRYIWSVKIKVTI